MPLSPTNLAPGEEDTPEDSSNATLEAAVPTVTTIQQRVANAISDNQNIFDHYRQGSRLDDPTE